MPPCISIITATRDAERVLPRLLTSLAEQSFRNFELIIQDGASQDNTLLIAESFRDRLPALTVNSAPDNGIYDAWNKALPLARGRWVLFLGADDALFEPLSLEQAAKALDALPDVVQYLASSIFITTPEGQLVERIAPDPDPLRALPSTMPLPHPALLHRADLFASKRFDVSLRIAGDYDFLAKSLTPHNYAVADLILTRMSVGGASGALSNLFASEQELLRLSKKYFPKADRGLVYKRIARSLLYKIIAAAAGEKVGRAFADLARRLRGKPPLWTLRSPSLPPLPEQPLVSLVTPTLDRKEALTRLLTSLEAQTYKNFELIIVDQNQPGFLEATLAGFPHLPVKRLRALPPPGVSAARNLALPLAGGAIIAFPDDDCWYAPDTLAQAVSFFKANPAAGGLIADWVTKESGLETSQSAAKWLTRFNAFHKAGTTFQFFRQEAAFAAGGFDEALGPGPKHPLSCGEDTDYLLNVLAAGFSAARAPLVRVCHPPFNPAGAETSDKAYAYGLGRMRLLRKHGFPFWFKLFNVFYPLLRLPGESILNGRHAARHRLAMFKGRLAGLVNK